MGADMGLLSDAQAIADDLVQLRRSLHQAPEVGLQLPRTQELVLTALHRLPLAISTGTGLTSITAVLRGGAIGGNGAHGGPVVLLRGDMDALPVTEGTGEEFASRNDGVMHACGHDLHTAGLVGAARLLCARQRHLAGDVVFMFQPGEEGWDGAKHMIEEGVLEAAGRPVDAAYGLHVLSAKLPMGVVASRAGTLMAGSGWLQVKVIGAGGHGSAPSRTIDPVPVVCEMVLALQTMVTRRFDVSEPVVVTVGKLQAGTKRNVIPGEAEFEATVRAFSADGLEKVANLSQTLCRNIAAAHGAQAEVIFTDECPVTITDADEDALLAGVAQELFGSERYLHLDSPLPGSEDFSRVLEKVPGAFAFLGATVGDPETAAPNHSPQARFDDSVLPDGAALLAELAIRRLAGPAT